ncbi:helix-turn-helix domain-containing protein [Paenibacillus apii]|uniref:helix-turn-helix domain-containing protein n=1 Tax=Paenibacillus apii TaxID=1850370 RepID=UPI001438AB83|nr:helix-turn-helix transcriptional regulator [Paenibacillus apii]NJJ37790.1 helix-turn-helix transcriptional regulator [Paenibacillus apii]
MGISILKRKALQTIQPELILPSDAGNRIKLARLAKEMTAREVSEFVGISETALFYIEGKKIMPSLSTLKCLSELFNLPVSYLGCFESLPEETLGQRIKKARMYQGLRVAEFAKLLGVDQKTINNWENDRRKPLSKHMKEIKKFVDTSL